MQECYQSNQNSSIDYRSVVRSGFVNQEHSVPLSNSERLDLCVVVTVEGLSRSITSSSDICRFDRRDASLLTRYATRMDREEVMRVLRAFESAGLEYVLIGAAAMGFHGLVRATEDLDLFIRATPENIEKLRSALRAAYEGDPNVNDITSADLLGEYPAVRYVPPTGDLYFDLMTRLGEVASFETIDAEVKEVAGTRVWVATPAALYRMKKATVRSQDHVDAAALRERFNLKEEG